MIEQFCIYHKQKPITNFCRTPSCSMPLCAECINDHYQFHFNSKDQPQIETISQTYQDVLKTVRQLYSTFGQNYQKLKEFYEYRANSKTLSQQLGEFKQKIQSVINDFFNFLQEEVEIIQKNETNHLEQQLMIVEQFLKEKNNELDNIARKIDGHKGIKYMIQILTSNFVQTSYKDSEKCNQFIYSLRNQEAQLLSNDNKIYDLNIQLAQLSQIQNKDFYLHYNNQAFLSDEKKDIHPLGRFQDMKSPYQYSQNLSAPSDQSFLARIQQRKDIPFSIKTGTPLSQSSLSYHSFPENQQLNDIQNKPQNNSQYLQQINLSMNEQLKNSAQIKSYTQPQQIDMEKEVSEKSFQNELQSLYKQYRNQEIEKYEQFQQQIKNNNQPQESIKQVSNQPVQNAQLYQNNGNQDINQYQNKGYLLFPSNQQADDIGKQNGTQYTFQNNSTKYHHY
ncbi:hypothetical protein ABPG74_021437 [Tetrahymena malaccensis]